VKIKQVPGVDWVWAASAIGTQGGLVGSLLLGLYERGLLHHVGFTSSTRQGSQALTAQRRKLVRHTGFTGRAPADRVAGAQALGRMATAGAADGGRSGLEYFTGATVQSRGGVVRWRPDKCSGKARLSGPAARRRRLRLLKRARPE